ncbi:MAG: homocysteine S-methyltransferase family protein [Planctomycetota bacterium]|jgi:5-methyltetrahydrofolate--homocysteine methyltransferase
MSSFEELLAARKVLVSDGAWGTMLAARGLPAGTAPEAWNLERPDEVRAVAAAYVSAGSDVILTNSFGGSAPKLEKAGLAGKVEEVNRRAAEISAEAAGGKALVFASMGPTGEFLQPLGDLSEDQALAVFSAQARALAAGGADGIVIETFTDLGEARCALRAARDATGLPVAASMTFEKGPAGYATMMGVAPAQAAEQLGAAGADAVGGNCGAGVEDMTEIVALIAPATSLPIWAKANAGLPELVEGQTVFRQTAADFAAAAPKLVAAGARIVGGCCGTTPEHIRVLAAAVRAG